MRLKSGGNDQEEYEKETIDKRNKDKNELNMYKSKCDSFLKRIFHVYIILMYYLH